MSPSDVLVAAAPRRAACPTCRAVFRGDYRRCPNDGAALVVGGPDPLVGTVLAERYRIEDVIGDGGLGRVYRARHVRMSRRYAIKVPFGDVGYDRKSRARLANEAEAASRLDHPNVIGIVDVGETEHGLFYMAMDLAEGKSLADVLAGGALPASEALGYLLQICAGLAHAHERGLIHRDLKPENVVVSWTSDGQPLLQIIDFGLALLSDAEGSRLTTDGLVVGTPYYMAPEQATDEPLDQRTDLFALGIMLYELLAGSLPFEGTPTAVARQNLAIDLPTVFERLGRPVDPLLDGLIGWMTRKRPDDRPESARVVADVARAILAGDRERAAAMLPESLRPQVLPPLAPHPEEPGPLEVSATPAASIASIAPTAPIVEQPRPPTSGVTAAVTGSGDRLTPLPDVVARNPLRRYALLAIGGLAIGAAVVIGLRARSGGGGDERQAATELDAAVPVAAAIDGGGGELAILAPDAAPASVTMDAAAAPVDAQAAEVIVRAGERRDPRPSASVAVVAPPIDARVAEPALDARAAITLAPPVDARAAITIAPPIDARASAIDVTPPTTSLRELYAAVTRAFNAAAARHGSARTDELKRRLDAVPPYAEAVRKPALRAQAEQELRAIARELAALGP